jgi:hypothetical protein
MRRRRAGSEPLRGLMPNQISARSTSIPSPTSKKGGQQYVSRSWEAPFAVRPVYATIGFELLQVLAQEELLSGSHRQTTPEIVYEYRVTPPQG